jgi:hypothetical protein
MVLRPAQPVGPCRAGGGLDMQPACAKVTYDRQLVRGSRRSPIRAAHAIRGRVDSACVLRSDLWARQRHTDASTRRCDADRAQRLVETTRLCTHGLSLLRPAAELFEGRAAATDSSTVQARPEPRQRNLRTGSEVLAADPSTDSSGSPPNSPSTHRVRSAKTLALGVGLATTPEWML